MTDRERLIKLLCVDPCDAMSMEDCEACKLKDDGNCFATRMADHLLANGVTFTKDMNAPSKMNTHAVWAWAVKNSVVLICWTALAVICDKWWIALFAAIFASDFKFREPEEADT